MLLPQAEVTLLQRGGGGQLGGRTKFCKTSCNTFCDMCVTGFVAVFTGVSREFVTARSFEIEIPKMRELDVHKIVLVQITSWDICFAPTKNVFEFQK